MITIFDKRLIDRMIRIYGFENPIVIDFCKIVETFDYKTLETIVKAHEEYPVFNED